MYILHNTATTCLAFCTLEIPKRGICVNSEDQDEMQHNAAFQSGSILFVKVKKDL